MRGFTEGQRKLVATGESLASIATSCGVSRPTAQRWKRGESTPREDARALLRDAYAINVGAWDVALPEGTEIEVPAAPKRGRRKRGAKPKPKPKPTPKSTTPHVHDDAPPYPVAPSVEASIVVNLRYSLSCIRHDLQWRDLTTSARSKLRSDEARTLGLIAKLQRDEELSEDRYVREHPAFVAHCDSILAALEPCPDCLARVAKALRK